MIRALWICPPLAFGRLGGSDTPLECFFWGPNDVRPRGTGKTTVLPGETLQVAPDGTVSSYLPKEVRFKDDRGFRPVCPFFELHGEWEHRGKSTAGPVTPEVLKLFKLDSSRLIWRVRAANLKPFHMTRDPQTRIEAEVEIRGDRTDPVLLKGVTPQPGETALVPPGTHIALGHVRLTKPNKEFPEYRARFIPPRGRMYGPPDLLDRWQQPDPDSTKVRRINIPKDTLFLNPKSSWCSWQPNPDLVGGDLRTVPEYLYAGEDTDQHVKPASDGDRTSFGVVDDTSDGIISCEIDGSRLPPAYARFTASPPDYAPDRRHVVSVADGLKDRVDRASVFGTGYVTEHMDLVEEEIRDLMERAFETMGLVNVDVFNNRVDVQENKEIAISRGIPWRPTDHYAFVPPAGTLPNQGFPLTDRGRQFHRRFVAVELFQDILRERPDLLERWVRKPLDANPFFDNRMPPVMRDSSGGPLHLTRRQYDLLRLWASELRKAVEDGS